MVVIFASNTLQVKRTGMVALRDYSNFHRRSQKLSPASTLRTTEIQHSREYFLFFSWTAIVGEVYRIF